MKDLTITDLLMIRGAQQADDAAALNKVCTEGTPRGIIRKGGLTFELRVLDDRMAACLKP